MKISDIPVNKIYIGLKIRSVKDFNKIGTIIDYEKDRDYFWILWDNHEKSFSGFFGNDCDCEIIS